MRPRNVLAIAILATTALLASVVTLAGADVPSTLDVLQTGEASTTSRGELAKLVPGAGFPGVYAARDWRKLDPSVYPVVGGHETFTWAELEPTEGNYVWTRLDQFIADQAALGKKAAIGITTYNGRIEDGLVVPTWFALNHPQALVTCTDIQVPRYWHATYRSKYASFVNALANHLGTNPNVAYVQIGIGLYGETQPSDDSDDTCIKNAMNADFGFTTDAQRSAKWVETVNGIVDDWAAAFNGRQRLFLVYTPRFIDVCEKRDETLYAASRYGVGLFAGGTYADTVSVFSVPPGGLGCQKWDPIVYWNNSPTSTIPVALESYRYMLPTYDEFYWGVLGVLNKHADYLSLESDLFFSGTPANPIEENLAVMRFANDYLGKTAATAPNAWIALRDTSPATNGHGCNRTYFWPQYGDYDYWLYRDDTVTGGRTITVSSVATFTIQDSACGTVGTVVANPQYDPVLAGKGPQGWMARRTDNASGNDYMYFRVDDAFVSAQGLTSTVIITITYLDRGLDVWQLQWRNAAGVDKSASVLKTNSGQWKTHTFTVSDISFTGQYTNGNDFRIWNGDSGDEYIHMVMIGKPKPVGPTHTPTRTRTVTPTATATPITVVFQQGISPSPSYMGVQDTYISNYGDPTTNHGTEAIIALRNNDQRAGLIKFDLSSIPAHASIESATLSMYVDHQTNPNYLPVSVHKVRRAWIDTQATWLNATDTVTWGLPGANDTATDVVATAAASETLTTQDVWLNFDVTTLVREWISNAGNNNGVLLRAGNMGNVEYRLRSSDYSTPADFRPKLTVNYRLPSGPTPTPTITRTPTRTLSPTRTSTPTQSPTPTPVTVVFQKGVSPAPSYAGVQDTFISTYGDPDSNYGISPTLSLRNNDYKAVLLRFDVSSIPPTVNVLSATVSLHVYAASNQNTLQVQAYQMLRSWSEMGATWNQATSGVPWAAPGANGIGADRNDVVLDTETLQYSGVWYDFDVTDLARLWIASPGQNFGVILKTSEGNQVEYEMWSSDYEFAPVVRPKLTIVYTTYFTGPTPTPTRTRTPTITLTPTRTPTPTPATIVFQRGVGPVPGFAGVYDTFISNFSDTTANYGISPTLELRSNDVRAALLRFDLSSLPPAANIVNATLSVHVDYKTNEFSMPVSLYRVLRSWDEMGATWINAAAGIPWAVPGANGGADRSTTATASLTMSAADAWYDFDVTNLARLWLTSPAENKGVILKAGTGPSVAYGLRSSEYFAAPGYRPKLTIQCYNCQVQPAARILLPVIISNFPHTP